MRKNSEMTFLSHPLGDLGVTYALHLYLVKMCGGKHAKVSLQIPC